MRFPSKVTSYKNSSIALFPVILAKIEEQDKTPSELYKSVKSKMNGIQEFQDILDCLYAMNKIELVGGAIHHVK